MRACSQRTISIKKILKIVNKKERFLFVRNYRIRIQGGPGLDDSNVFSFLRVCDQTITMHVRLSAFYLMLRFY